MRLAATSYLARVRALLFATVALSSLAAASGAHGAHAAHADSFEAAMHAAMAKMDEGMRVPMTGDPDRDFARMMIPHHQGAVDMAIVELRFGKDERLRRLAQAIVVEQRQEIQVMQQALESPAPGRPPSP